MKKDSSNEAISRGGTRALGRFITRFSTDGEGDEKQVDIKISSSENVEIFLSSIPIKIAKNLKNNGCVTQCQFSVSTNNNRKLYSFSIVSYLFNI